MALDSEFASSENYLQHQWPYQKCFQR